MPPLESVEFEFRDDPANGGELTVREFSGPAVATVDGVLDDRFGLERGDLRIVVAADVLAAVDDLVHSLGLPDGQAGLTEILGGTAGKTLVDERQRPVAIVAAGGSLVSAVETIAVIAHELGHVLSMTVDAALGAAWTSIETIFDVDAVAALSAVDEYRSDRFARSLCSSLLRVTDANDVPIDIWADRRTRSLASVDAQLTQLMPALPDLVADWQAGKTSDADLMADVGGRLREATLFAGYYFGAVNDDDPSISDSDHPAVSLVAPLWAPLFNHAFSSDLVPARTDWAADRAEIDRIGRDGAESIYRSLGVTRRTTPDGYEISYDPPT